MPFVFVIFGIICIISAAKNTQGELLTLLEGDFIGSGNFVYWIISIGVVGALGYVKELKGFSNAMLALVLVVLFLSHPGFFGQFQAALDSLKHDPVLKVQDTVNAGVETSPPAPASSSGGGLSSLVSTALMFV